MNVGGIAASVLLHVGLFTVITRAHAPIPVHKKTVISITEKKKPPEQKKPDPKPAAEAAFVEPVKTVEPPKPKPQPKANPAPKAEPAPEGDGNAPPPGSGAPALDLGNMTFTNDSGNGVAVSPDSLGRDPNAEAAQPKPKAKPRAAEKVDPDKLKRNGGGADDCTEELVKPKAVSKLPIDYPAAAREQGIEGQLVLRAHVGADGKVGEVEVVTSAGALIDEPAIASLKSWTFEPATKCGKPVESTYTVSRRFELGT
jgi:periplasmic protein TonB